MPYVTVRTWRFSEGFETDERVTDYVTESLRQLKEHGAEQSFMVKISDTDSVILSIYPDEAAYQDAAATLARRRAGAGEGAGGTMIENVHGPTILDL